MAGLSLLAFDSGYRLSAILFVVFIWLYPLLPIGCAIRAWWLYWHGKQRSALITTSIPLIVVLPLVFYGASAMLASACRSQGEPQQHRSMVGRSNSRPLYPSIAS